MMGIMAGHLRFLAVGALLTLFAAAIAPPAAVAQATRPVNAAPIDNPGGEAVVVVADGDVDNFMRDSIRRRVNEARELGADTVILRIDTYGGLVTAGLEISRFLKQQDDLHLVAFIDEKAISAGAMIALACDEIVMEPASQIGDSGVIAMGPGGGPQALGDTERAKAESPVVADFDDSARRNGYSTLLAQSFVLVNRDVYAIQNVETGERRFVDGKDYDRLVNGGPFESERTDWEPVPDVPVPLVSDTGLLTVSNVIAERIGLSTGTYLSPQEFAADRGMTIIATLTPTAGERFVGLLTSFAFRGVLMTVLFFSIYAAFSTPGTGLPEVVAATALAVLFGVPWLAGYAQWYELVAVLLGLVLLIVELFLIPGFGVFGISGLILIFGGLAMTFVGPIMPSGMPAGVGVDWSGFADGLLTALIGLVASIGLWIWLGRYLPKLPYARGLILDDMEPSEEEAARAAAWPLVGATGVAVSDLRPGGTAKFAITDAPDDTANADVVCDRGFVPAGTPLNVVEVAGNRVVVRPMGGKTEG